VFEETGKTLRYCGSFLRKSLVHLNLQITYRCNFKCRICDFWNEPYTQMTDLTAEHAEVISDKLARGIGPLIVSIGGGEPMMHRELPQIVRALAKHHFPVMICNGWFITPEKARELFASGLYEISVSVDYASAAKHDAQRGVDGAFDRAIAALEVLHANRQRSNQRVHMISVVMDDNLDEIEPLIRLSEKIGVTYLVTMYSSNRGAKENKASHAGVSKHLLELQKRYPRFVALRDYIGRFDQAMDTGVSPCYAGKNLFNIDSCGDVSRCIDRIDTPAGNILSGDVGQIQRDLLAQFESGDCSDCWTSCRGNFESLLYGGHPLRSLVDSYRVTRSIPLGQRA